jgi:head-tail adaptor
MSVFFSSLLNNTFSIQRVSRMAAGHGNFPKGLSAVGSVDGRIRPASATEKQAAAQESREITHVLYVAASTDIARGDHVTCGDLVVKVLGVREPSKAGHHLEVDCLEIQVEQTSD